MAVLERSELEASPLADLHAIANQVGLEGFRRLRKAELIDAILGEASSTAERDGGPQGPRRSATAAAAPRSRCASARAGVARCAPAARGRTRRAPLRTPPTPARSIEAADGAAAAEADAETATGARRGRRRSVRGGSAGADESARRALARTAPAEPAEAAGRIAAGVVEVLGNGSAFLRVDPPEPSDEDVYISAAQVRRCELVSGDRVTGPVRTPRRSERYPSLVRIDTINGASADTVSDGARYDELPVDWPRERLALGSQDPTLEAIEWLTPLGRGSRAVIVGARHAGKTETLRRLLEAVARTRGSRASTLVLAGARPEEIAQWREGPVAPVAALTFAASADSQDQAVERAIDAAKRVAARGGRRAGADRQPRRAAPAGGAQGARGGAQPARRRLADRDRAPPPSPLGGETTVIALDVALTSTGRQPILDLVNSGTLKPELLVGEDGAEAITKARARGRWRPPARRQRR